jgi:1,4-alpha-glucan branching enzyme
MLYLDYSRGHGEWIPNRYGGRENLGAVDFLRRLNELVYQRFPDAVTVAEESTAWPMVSRPVYMGGLGFGCKWNMGWMNDTLRYLGADPVYRKYHHGELTFSLLYAYNENFVLPLSHDEVVHGKGSLLEKMPGDTWQKFANLRLLYGYLYCHPGKKLLFMGSEFGQWREWNEGMSLDWHLLEYPLHEGCKRWVRDLNTVCRREAALHERDFEAEGFRWIDCHDSEQSVVSFLRFGLKPEDVLACVCNFTPVPRHNYRIGVPPAGGWEEILNSDAACYGGSGQGNEGRRDATPVASHGFYHSLNITVPPLGVVIFRPESQSGAATQKNADGEGEPSPWTG